MYFLVKMLLNTHFSIVTTETEERQHTPANLQYEHNRMSECKFVHVKPTCSSSSTTTRVSLFFLKSRRVILGLFWKHVN